MMLRNPILLAAMVLGLMGSAALSSSRAQRIRPVSAVPIQTTGPAISTGQARILESRLSALPATKIVDQAATAPAPPPAEPPPADANMATPAAEPPPQPVRARLEYVPTDAVLERQVTQALVSQNAIRRVIGSSGAILPFPGILRQVEPSGEEIQLKAFGLSGKKLRFNPARQMYSGTIWLGVTEIVGGRPSRPLVTPVDFEVLDAEFAKPAHIRVLRTGSPYTEVELQLAAAIDGGKVTVASNLVPEPIKLDLPVNPSLLVEAGQSAIEGLGLATSEVNVSLVGLAKPKGRVVTLRTTSGYLGATKLQMDENGFASTTIRSDGLGSALITASSPGMAATSTDITYRLPVITFLASIIGGLVGGAIRVGTRPPRRRWSAVRLLFVAILLGLLVFALYAVGVNVLPVSPSVTVGAALVFAVSGLGAFLGPSILRHAP
jgi:hypothetical protein